MIDNPTVDDLDEALANVNRQRDLANPKGRLPPIDWKRGQRPAWEERIAKDRMARSMASGGTSGE